MDHRSSLQRKAASWPTVLWVISLTLITLLVHGFHPDAEDGGIYTAGIYLRLHPSLFPHDAAFVRAPMAYSQFAWLMASVTQSLHLPPSWTIFLAYLLTVGLTLLAAKRVAEMCHFNSAEQWGALALLAAWWTLPVAGTSLNIGDPYLTARSFSTPLSLLATSFALEEWRDGENRLRWRPILLCVCSLLLCAFLHRLMFSFAAVFVLMLRARMSAKWPWLMVGMTVCAVAISAVVRAVAQPESTAFLRAQLTRSYWFLSEWRWFELAGLLAPLLIFAVFKRTTRREATRNLCATSMTAGALFIFIPLVFATQHATSHVIARLQPLRMFMLLYVVMTLMVGGWLVRYFDRLAGGAGEGWQHRWLKTMPIIALSVAAFSMLAKQEIEFASSRHIEAPWLQGESPNPWMQAFAWCQRNTAEDALFAIDAFYIHSARDDAQTFRASALRSVLPDQSKDGGEAAVDEALAGDWQRGMDASRELNKIGDAEREARLQPLGVSWLVLTSVSQTRFDCPYDNTVVKVCKLGAAN